LRAVRHDEIRVGVGEHAEGVEAYAAHGEERVRRHVDQVGKLHAADVVIMSGREQSRLRVRGHRFAGGCRHAHARAVEHRLFDIRTTICGDEARRCDALAQVEHRAERLARVLGKSRPRRQ